MSRQSWIHFWVTQKFRFDLGISFIVFVNFALLSITASEKVQMLLNRWGIDFNIYSIIVYIILFAFFSTWLFGYLLDKIIKYQDNLMNVQNARNPQLLQILENTNIMKAKIIELEQEIKELKNKG